MAAAPIKCPRPTCGEVLATSTPAALTVAGAVVAVVSSVTLVCPKCGTRRKWHPTIDTGRKRR